MHHLAPFKQSTALLVMSCEGVRPLKERGMDRRTLRMAGSQRLGSQQDGQPLVMIRYEMTGYLLDCSSSGARRYRTSVLLSTDSTAASIPWTMANTAFGCQCCMWKCGGNLVEARIKFLGTLGPWAAPGANYVTAPLYWVAYSDLTRYFGPSRTVSLVKAMEHLNVNRRHACLVALS